MLLPGRYARAFRVHSAKTLCRVFAGDPNLHVDIENNRASLNERDRRDLVRNVPEAAAVDLDPRQEGSLPPGTDLVPFCGRSCASGLDLTQLMPIPGLSTELPPIDEMKRHGNYLFVLGMFEWHGVTIIVLKPGASFHGQGGMHGRFMIAQREFPHLSVMFMEPCSATMARDGESAMKQTLTSLGNAYQIGGSEKWIASVAPGMQPADAARTLSNQLRTSLPLLRLEPAPGSVPDEVARAFRAATSSMGADGACALKGRMWTDESGHRYDVEVVRAEAELERHKVDKRAEVEMEVEKHKQKHDAEIAMYGARMANLQKSLADGLITQEQYLASLN